MTTTPEKKNDLVRLCSAANAFQAHIWQQGLEREGIHCQVLGDYLDGGIGDISGITAEIWVEPADLARGVDILRQHRDRSEEATQPDERVAGMDANLTTLGIKHDEIRGGSQTGTSP
jgi:putative signal transducing protein